MWVSLKDEPGIGDYDHDSILNNEVSYKVGK